MSIYYINTAAEQAVDSPTLLNETNGNCDSDGQGGCSDKSAEGMLDAFWPKVNSDINKVRVLDIRNQALPLARIKKIMKLDEDVKMISAEAPMLFAKACEIFITELTLRAWVHTEDNKRRTLQRSDIAMAITKYDQFDFLIDIVPREEAKVSMTRLPGPTKTNNTANQNQGNVIPNNGVNILNGGQMIQVQNLAGQAPTQQTGIQLLQQIVTPNGEIQHIPVILQLPVQGQQIQVPQLQQVQQIQPLQQVQQVQHIQAE